METVSASFASKRTKILQDSERQLMKSGKPPHLIPHSHIVFAYLLYPHAPMRHNGLQLHVAARRGG
jgi:hypothetical protein